MAIIQEVLRANNKIKKIPKEQELYHRNTTKNWIKGYRNLDNC